ncbi:pre-piRNA 3'-exonuclease trimmer-like [Haliotis rubra]|uniref:pre-piRNA 3'-exonuclease trimmer-like n=1 Tax=Haliotis rubra TaxID=36100 RepID=UPI001EE5A1D8|nr:pre-piRNA 3'-exonuclease trimmer-like [Haliotis rubra]
MCEVTKNNLENYLPLIEKSAKQADFIAIDTEFTGLTVNDSMKYSLFDSGEDRYKKLRCSISQFTVCQIGVSAFVKQGTENRYSVRTFNFHLFPRSFGPHDPRFLIQSSSVEFLCRYNFDFQELMYKGISFLNGPQEDMIREHLSKKLLFQGLNREVDERVLQQLCSQVAEKFVTAKKGDTFIVQKTEEVQTISDYVLHNEIRNRFPSVWTSTDHMGNFVVEVVTSEKRRHLEEDSQESREQQQLLNTLLGFTRVFRILTECKKPLIGHNMLMDLMFLYDKFFQPLPRKYQDFKNSLHQLFPIIYDTKHMAFSLRKELEDKTLVESTSLQSLYSSLDSIQGKQRVLFSPDIQHGAGYDRYRKWTSHLVQCGYVFLRLAHIITLKDVRSTEAEPCSFMQYSLALKSNLNSVNMIRAAQSHIRLDAADPPSRKPELLYVKSRRIGHSLSAEQLAQWFSPYGSVDVRLMSAQRGLVATGNYRCAKDILENFKKHDQIRVCYYSVWRHSPVVRRALWTSVVVSGGICLWVLYSSSRKT